MPSIGVSDVDMTPLPKLEAKKSSYLDIDFES